MCRSVQSEPCELPPRPFQNCTFLVNAWATCTKQHLMWSPVFQIKKWNWVFMNCWMSDSHWASKRSNIRVNFYQYLLPRVSFSTKYLLVLILFHPSIHPLIAYAVTSVSDGVILFATLSAVASKSWGMISFYGSIPITTIYIKMGSPFGLFYLLWSWIPPLPSLEMSHSISFRVTRVAALACHLL